MYTYIKKGEKTFSVNNMTANSTPLRISTEIMTQIEINGLARQINIIMITEHITYNVIYNIIMIILICLALENENVILLSA